jgi:hypothetical protein
VPIVQHSPDRVLASSTICSCERASQTSSRHLRDILFVSFASDVVVASGRRPKHTRHFLHAPADIIGNVCSDSRRGLNCRGALLGVMALLGCLLHRAGLDADGYSLLFQWGRRLITGSTRGCRICALSARSHASDARPLTPFQDCSCRSHFRGSWLSPFRLCRRCPFLSVCCPRFQSCFWPALTTRA